MQEKEVWAPIEYPNIVSGYMISSHGRIKSSTDDSAQPYEPSYHSSNGYDYAYFVTNDRDTQLFPIDDIVASTFLMPDKELYGKPIKVIHINGNNRDNHAYNLTWVEDKEEWRDAKCYIPKKDGRIISPKPGAYKVSNHGKVYSNITNTYLKPYQDAGYWKIDLSYIHSDGTYGGSPKVKLHRLLAITFDLPNHSEERDMINHIDGNKSNCSLKNLEWVTCRENVRHAFDALLEINPKGESHYRSKFTDHQRECIYAIVKELKDIQPSHVTGLIKRRLPRITREDIKHAKNIIHNTEGFEFPDLSSLWRNPVKFTDEEYEELIKRVDIIFDKYDITETQEYMTDYDIRRMKKQNREGEDSDVK